MVPVESSFRNRTSLSDRYRVLLDIGRALTRTFSLPELFRQIYHETSKVLDTSGFYVSLYDAPTDRATIVFYADRGVERHVEVEYRGSESDVLHLGEPSTFTEGGGSGSILVLGDEDSELTRSAISAPMRCDGAIIGAVSAQSYRAGSYSDEDLELLQGIADMAAVAIENGRTVAEIQARRKEAEQIEEIGRAMAGSLESREVLGKVIDATLELVSCDVSSVWFLEPDFRIEVAASGGDAPMRPGLSWELSPDVWTRVVQARDPFPIPDVQTSGLVPDALKKETVARSVLLVPLVVEGKVAGALAVGSRHEKTFDEDLSVIERLASQASVALENARLHSSVQALSLTDPLTGLPNRRHLDLHLSREVAAARRGRSLCLVMFDLDNFKQYNDTLGHQAGDRILAVFGEILLDESRTMNLVARYGGDEFVSVLSDTHLEGVRVHAARVTERVREDPRLRPHGISVSWGIGEFVSGMEGAGDLIRAADEELFRVKEGRKSPPSSHGG